MLRFQLLGPLRVRTDRDDVLIGGGNARTVVGRLLLSPNRRVSIDELIDALWSEAPPPTAKNTVQVYISKLRRAFEGAGESDRISNVAGGYSLTVRPGELDIDEVRARAAAGRRAIAEGRAEDAMREFGDVLALWQGTPLEDFLYEDFAQDAIRELEDLWVDTLEDRADALLSLGLHADAVRDLLDEADRHPGRERLVTSLMLALYRAGRQQDATGLFHRHRAFLADELGLDPSPAVMTVHDQLLRHDSALDAPPAAPTGLPVPITSFVGRNDELQLAADLLAGGARLLSLTGPGGVGKTRLATQLAMSIGPRYTDVVFIDLVSLTDASELLPSIASAFRWSEGDDDLENRLGRHLSGRRSLIVLDNFEHLVEGAHVVGSLLSRTHQPQFVVTTRIRLGLTGEYAMAVPPLALHSPDGTTDSMSPAVTLFLERARAAKPELRLDEGAIAHAIDVCRRLDGVPLAIELAAARCDVLSLLEITDLVARDQLSLSTRSRDVPERHRSLASTLEWSGDMLSGEEGAVLTRLAVVTGPFDLEGATHLCTDIAKREALVDVIGGLIDQSFVQRVTVEDGLYLILQTVRAFVLARPGAAEDAKAARLRYVEFVASMAADAEEGLRGPDQERWLSRLRSRIDSIKGALAVAFAVPLPREAASIVSSLTLYWCMSGSVSEGRPWAERAWAEDWPLEEALRLRLANACGQLAEYQSDFDVAEQLHREVLRETEARANVAARIDALCGLAIVSMWHGDPDTSLKLSDEALTLANSVGDLWRKQHILGNMAGGHYLHGDAELARSELLDALRVNESIGNLQGRSTMLANLSVISIEDGDFESAAHFAQDAQDLAARLGDASRLASAASNHGLACAMLGRLAEAGQSLAAAMSLTIREGDRRVLASTLEATALLASRRGWYDDAAVLYGAADSITETLNLSVPPGLETEKEEDISHLKKVLGKDVYERAREIGHLALFEDIAKRARRVHDDA